MEIVNPFYTNKDSRQFNIVEVKELIKTKWDQQVLALKNRL